MGEPEQAYRRGVNGNERYLPSDIGTHPKRTAVQGDEGAFAARRPTAGHVPVVWVRRPAEDVVIRLAPLCARVTTDRQYRGADGADRAQYIKGAP